MKAERIACKRCGKWMDEGYLLEKGDHNSASPTRWIEGRPEKSFWTGLVTKNRRTFVTTALRCQGCACVELFAPEV